jgi:hyperosmotically inducible periplasmic protein
MSGVPHIATLVVFAWFFPTQWQHPRPHRRAALSGSERRREHCLRASNLMEGPMNSLMRLAVAFATGAAIMYYLDPQTGRRRRALARDKGVGARHEVEDFARKGSRRMANRVRGTLARTRARMAPALIDDDQLLDRIHSKLGHLVDAPGMVDVQVHDGWVVLTGSASPREIDALVHMVVGMPGVRHVNNRLSPGGERDTPPPVATDQVRH